MSYEGFSLSEVGNSGCELTRRAIYFMLQRGSTVGSVLGGLVGATDLAITYAGSGLKVEAAPGECIIPGHNATQSGYYFRNTSAATFTPSAANASNPRVEAIVARVLDKSYEGAANEFKLELVEGTAKAGATLTNLEGAAGQSGGPSLPTSVLVLGYVLVPAGATTINSADIKNVATAVALGLQNTSAWTLLTNTAKTEGTALARTEQSGAVARLRGTVRVKTGQTVSGSETLATLPASCKSPNYVEWALVHVGGGITAPVPVGISGGGTALLAATTIAENVEISLDGITYPLT